MENEESRIHRRDFLKRSICGVGLGMSWPAARASASAPAKPRIPEPAQEVHVILFQGDSITDAYRSKEVEGFNVPHGLGSGYVGLAVAELLGQEPGSPWQCYNRGISGNKVYELAERWQEDCLDFQPDVLSVLIGVNDFWHTLSGYEGTFELYERDYRALLDRTREALPDVKLILGEPFAVAGGTAITEQWQSAFHDYRAAARRVADDYSATWIPYQSLFDEALKEAPAAYWAPDGVHPAPAGNYLMAQAWLEAFAETLR